MIGGYAQFTYAFNYWGPPGVNRDTFVVVKKLASVGQARTAGVDHGRTRPRLDGLPPRQVHRVPHVQRRLQERVDRPPRRRIHVVEQRRDQARHRLSDALGGPGHATRAAGSSGSNGRAPEAALPEQGSTPSSKLFYNPNQPNLARLLRAVDLHVRRTCSTRPRATTSRPRVPISQITGEPIDIEAGPNWDDDLSGSPIYAENDLNLDKLTEDERAMLFEIERISMLYLPRICNHCANPSCVASCPSGAIYKRGEDGIVLINQESCRGWRACVAACPYKKIYYNWKTGKSEKCILCFPRLETGQAPGVLPLVRRPHPLPGRAALRRRPRARCHEGAERRAGRVAASRAPRSRRSRRRRRRAHERHQRRVHRVGAAVAGLQVRDGVEARAAAARRVPHDADALLRAAAAARHGDARRRHLRARRRRVLHGPRERRACRSSTSPASSAPATSRSSRAC